MVLRKVFWGGGGTLGLHLFIDQTASFLSYLCCELIAYVVKLATYFYC